MNGLTTRQLALAVAFPIVVAIFVILGILVLRKDSKYWGNRCFALFFWIVALALGFNLLYLFSEDEVLIKTLNIATIETVNVGITALLIGIMVIYKGEEEVIHSKKTYLVILLVALIIIAHIFIPEVWVATDYDPRWRPPFGLYEILFSQAVLISIFYLSFAFYKELSSEIRVKFKRYLIGLTFLDITLLSISFDNMYIFGAGYAMINSLLTFCVVIGAILIYFGIVRR